MDNKVKEAIAIIAEEDSLLGQIAWRALDNNDIIEFVQFITDQCDQGNTPSLCVKYGHETIKAILDYGKLINIIADVRCQDICVLMDGINLN